LAMERPEADYQVFNLGTGVPTSVLEIADMLSEHLTGGEIKPEIRNQFRAGDIRHCYADVTAARQLLGFEPSISLADGLEDLLAWVREQSAEDRFDQVERELATKSLVV
ncbi:MAG: NAD-dependent epimerase/dehydratase family protein, partial [Anaerolineae bacterium]